MANEFNVTPTSGISVGFDPARADLTPRGTGQGAVLSVGTVNNGIVRIVSSVVSVDPASMAAGSSSTLTVALGGCTGTAAVVGHPISSLWSAEYTRLNYSVQPLGDGVVEIGFSNTTGATVNAVELNWRVTAFVF